MFEAKVTVHPPLVFASAVTSWDRAFVVFPFSDVYVEGCWDASLSIEILFGFHIVYPFHVSLQGRFFDDLAADIAFDILFSPFNVLGRSFFVRPLVPMFL